MSPAHEDVDDLYGDAGSDGSLFGDGEDSGSLFCDDESDETSADMTNAAEVHEAKAAAAAVPLTPPTLALPPLPAITLPPLRDGPISVGLSLPPTGSDPHGALSRGHVGHTSDHHVVSTPNPYGNEWGMAPSARVRYAEAGMDGRASNDQSIDTFAPGSHSYGNHEGHIQDGVTPEYSPDFAYDDTVMLDDAELQLQQDLLAESGMSRPFENSQQVGMGPDEVFQYSKYTTYHGKRLPRQVDLDENGIRFLTPYVSLNRTNSIKRQYERLELGLKLGTKLSKELRGLIQSSEEFAPFLKRHSTSYITPDKRRGDYLRLAISLLKHQGWGERWFGALSVTGCSRNLVWPAESTLITLRFVSLVYKFVEQMKNPRSKKETARMRLANSPAPSRCSIGSSQGELIDLTGDPIDLIANDDYYVQQGLILTPAPSAPTSRPTSSHADHSSQPQHPHQVVDQTTATGSTAPPMSEDLVPTPPAYSPPVAHVQRIVQASQGESIGSPPPTDNVNLASNSGPMMDPAPTGGGLTTVSQLAAHVVGIKRRKMQPAEMREKAVYRLYFLDKKDGLEFCSPMTFDMDADLVQGDVVANLQAAFHMAGEPANIYIYMTNGYRQVRNSKEWQETVLCVLQDSNNKNTLKVAVHI